MDVHLHKGCMDKKSIFIIRFRKDMGLLPYQFALGKSVGTLYRTSSTSFASLHSTYNETLGKRVLTYWEM